jgi:outer membrane receptor protein involved in Fe transport
MNVTRLLATTALPVIALVTTVTPAFAQSAPSAAECRKDPKLANCPAADEGEAIVVTGSRIRRPNLESTVPITSIAGDQFFDQGRNNVGDTLNDLPQLRSTFAQQNPGLGVGIAGLNLLDLRGLGTVRTLVLVNGRRHVPSDILNNASSVDINTIPTDLIERVDIVTGGNSAIYGSDAIAGVVNFVLKKSFEGVQVRGNAAIAAAGFGGNQFVSATVGKNFADGRGNITLSGEFARQDRVFGSDIPWYQSVDGLFVTDVDPAGLTNGSDGFPDRTYLTDSRSTTINRYGIIPINQTTTNPTCGVGLAQTNGAGSSTPTAGGSAGVPYSCTYIFTQAGRLVQQTGTRFGTGANSGILGGNGQTGREEKLLSVYPYQQRYSFNLLGHYEFSPAADLFVEAKWSRVNTLGSNAGPSFTQGTGSQFDTREKVRLDNPFLNPADRTTLANLILTSGCAPSFTVNCGTGNLTAANITAINDGSYRVVIGRHFADSGIRDEYFERDTWRVVGGLRGTFNDDWNYEISGNYGKFTQKTTTFGYVDKQRFLLSFDAGRNPVTGQIQCRAQFDPASAIAYPATATNAARLAADIAACVPYNPFGGQDNSAAARYFVYNSVDRAKIEQFVLSGFVSGDTSGFFNLWGGPVRFAVGGEYRSEKAVYQQDPFAEAGNTNAIAGLSFAPSPFRVTEGYGEIELPILKDRPFFHDLSLSGAARIAKYQGGVGTVWSYNYGGEWAPIKDIRFRANYGRAVRAPNVTETASPLVPNFAPGFSDPCRAGAIGTGSQYRNANCQADLGALLTTSSFANQNTYSLAVLSGSNPNLNAEKSDSWTFGTVIQPRFIPNLSLSVDYYNIKVNGVITSASAQQIANGCYDAPTLNNPFCALFTRYRGTGTGPLGEVPGQIQGNTLIQAPLNYAKRIRKGIDTQINYRVDLGSNVKLSTSLIYTHVFTASNFTNPQDPTFENVILSELGDPEDEFRLDADLTVGEVTFGYRLQFIGPMYVNTFEDFNSLGGRAPENADYANIAKYPIITYHALRVQWDKKNAGPFGKGFQLYAGVDNVFDQHPPLGSTGTGAGSSIYDIRGRNLYAGFRVKF